MRRAVPSARLTGHGPGQVSPCFLTRARAAAPRLRQAWTAKMAARFMARAVSVGVPEPSMHSCGTAGAAQRVAPSRGSGAQAPDFPPGGWRWDSKTTR